MNEQADADKDSASPWPAKLVETLYRGLFGRDPEPDAVRHWVAALEAGTDVRQVLGLLMASPEYVERTGEAIAAERRIGAVRREAARLLAGAQMIVVDVGAQILGYEDHIYAPLMQDGMPCRIIGFEPLEHRAAEWRRSEKNLTVTMYPAFIGDGARHLFHQNDPDATSSLLPFNEAVIGTLVGLTELRTTKVTQVKTETLDNVLSEEPRIDFLKFDIQGFELPALTHAAATLARTLVVHCEVSFVEIYEGQALFSDVEAYLRKSGFRFMDFSYECRYAVSGGGATTQDQLGWADAVFFRDWREGDDPQLLLRQSIIASLVYRKLSLGAALAGRYVRQTGADVGGLLAP